MNNIKQLRLERGLSLGDLSKKAGCSISLLSKMERGERSVTFKWIKSLATALEVRPEDITGENVVSTTTNREIPAWIYMKEFHIDITDMNRILPNGCSIYADQDATLDDKGIYVIRMGDKLMVRRLRLADGPLRFEADSYTHQVETIYPQSGFTILGRVRGALIHMD